VIKHDLNGAWKMRQVGLEKWHEAIVPGSVYGDLLRDGTIPDPFFRENEREAFDLLKNEFEYERTFCLDDEILAASRLILRFEGIDTLADVYLNGALLASVDNMHITWEWDVKDFLCAGENTLRILFHSPITYALDAFEKSPGWYSTDAIPGFQHVRKVHCMYGWDWGPRLPDAGIWRDVSLLAVDEGRITDVLVLQHHNEGHVRLEIKPEFEMMEGKTGEWTALVTAPSGKQYTADANGIVDIDAPELWWPAGYGSQPLYLVEVRLTSSGAEQDVWTARIGLRTLSISRDKDQWGEEFCHIVNGVKVFAMGGDYIPEDNLFGRITPERTRRLLEDAKLANFNTIRIWGGGYYPPDFFFDICDELGLMVWQDFMYACAFYDLTPDFERSIRKETEQNVRRMRIHPSLALLCGNNEMEMFQARALEHDMTGRGGGFAHSAMHHHADYIKMFEYLIPSICEKEAPQTYYWPASPSSGGSFDDPNAENRGDVHYWDVWHGEKPFTDYRNYHFRYTSEFGFQSFPCLKTVESFTLPEDRNIFSRIMERHQRNQAANGKILSYLSQTYLYPTDFDQLLYASQLMQADAIRYGVEHWRRNRGRCMGAVIWQLNDCWPVASWASIDYFGRWKALHYAAKRFFAPVMISCCEEGEITQNPKINEFMTTPILCSARLSVVNETMQPVSGEVRWSLRNAEGTILQEGSKSVTVEALSSLWLDKLEFEDASLLDNYLSFAFVTDEKTVSEGTVIFCAPKHFHFADPELEVERDDEDIIITAKAYAKSVCIESDDPDMLISDNFFDMNPGQRRVHVLRGKADGLKVRSVYNIR